MKHPKKSRNYFLLKEQLKTVENRKIKDGNPIRFQCPSCLKIWVERTPCKAICSRCHNTAVNSTPITEWIYKQYSKNKKYLADRSIHNWEELNSFEVNSCP